MRSGRRIAFDIGKARIGVAVSDFHAILASPSQHILRTELNETINNMLEVCNEVEAIEIYVGLPINLKGQSTESTKDAVALAKQLAIQSSAPVILVDERLTTTAASRSMTEAGKSVKNQRSYIDSAAAALILEQALETERQTGSVKGTAAKDYQDE